MGCMQVGEWLNQGEGLVHSEDVPSHLNEEAAAVLNQKIDDHKAFFADLEHVREQGRGDIDAIKTFSPCRGLVWFKTNR